MNKYDLLSLLTELYRVNETSLKSSLFPFSDRLQERFGAKHSDETEWYEE